LAEQSEDEAAIEALFDTQSRAWERADSELFASAFSTDADFINITATALRGREAIARHHAQLWATLYKGATVTAGPRRIRFVRPDIALIENEATLRMGETERHAHALVVAVRNDGQWEIEALHNMIPFVPPAAGSNR
jgi:uncharacterized protein (TIGR02246 family)